MWVEYVNRDLLFQAREMVLFSDHNADNFFIGESHWFNHQTAQVINSLLDIGADNTVIGASAAILHAISTALKALDTTDETFIAQLLEAPSQIMPVISLTILIIAVLMVLMSRVNSHAIPAAAPIAAVEAAHSADKRV